ncbi:response regulator [Burkholderia cenocepacia]|nr:response regulator [Burkholderia cenocepacia]
MLLPMLAEAANIELTSTERAWINQHPIVRYAIDPYWKPIEYSDDGVATGLSVAYLEKAAKLAGLKLSFEKTNTWEQSIARFANDDVDLLPGVPDFELPQPLERTADLTSPYFISSTIIVTNAKNRILNDLDDFSAGDVIAMRGGGAYEAWMRRRHPTINLQFYKSSFDALAAVVAGNATAAIGPEPILHPLIRQKFRNSLYVAGVAQDMPLVLRVATNKSSPQLKAIMQKAITAISAGESDAIQVAWVEDADYGRPSIAILFKYYGLRIALIATIMVLMILALLQMRRLQVAADRLARQRAAFLATMTHEIRNPLNYIISSIEMAQMHAADSRVRGLIEVAANGAHLLLELANRSLDYWRIESCGHVNRREVGVGNILKELVPAMRILAEKKGLKFNVSTRWAPDIPLLLDDVGVKQILINIISNSIKFTDHGSISLSVYFDDCDGFGCVVFEVVDTGSGISTDDIDRVFNPFFRGGADLPNRSGAGLGLSVCKELANRMRGNLIVRSDLGKGTTVVVRLPAISVVPSSLSGNRKSPEVLLDGGMRALIVEDVIENQMILRDQLECLGFQVVVADSGSRALSVIEEIDFDVMFLDCNLPDMSGFDITREIRCAAAKRKAGAPIIGMSADRSPGQIQRCEESGMTAILFKPISLLELRGVVGDIVGCVNGGGSSENDVYYSGDILFSVDAKRAVRVEAIVAAKFSRKGEYEKVAFHIHRIRGIALTFKLDWLVEFVDRNPSLSVDLAKSERVLRKLAKELRESR